MEIFDNHVHVRPGAVSYFSNVFRKAGGTALNLVNLTEECLTLEQFVEKYEETEKVAGSLRKEGFQVVISIGPYPVNYISIREREGVEKAGEIYRKAVEVAIRHIKQGKANAIGEVGRPHFPVPDEIILESNDIISYIFEASRDDDIPVILHTESLDKEGMCSIMKVAEKAGKRTKVVKHFSPPIFSDNCGIIPSVPAGRKNARAAPWGERNFFLETDFAGDEGNPNFVLPADSVPKRVSMLIQEGIEVEKIERSMSFYREFYGL
ncbi:MAG: TatD family hydrolase [Thermoplasmatales archaeon]